jgi:hypothetical protein
VAKCNYCGTLILFGGEREGERRFCNATCREAGFIVVIADHVPAEDVAQQLRQLHSGNCPKCGGEGPVDVHTSHRIWSALVMTSYTSRPDVCCRRCAVKAKLGGITSSALLGWWGFPWGVLGTPIQISRNLFSMVTMPDPSHPSPLLENMVRLNIAAEMIAEDRAEQEQAAVTATAGDPNAAAR